MAAKRKRQLSGRVISTKVEVKKVIVRNTFSKFGVAEVDKIVQGRKFKLPTNSCSTHTTNDVPCDKKTKEDRIGNLPNDILLFIISFLTLREQACTSILSNRWRNLWSQSVSSLNLNFANMIGCQCDYPEKGIDQEVLTNLRSHFRQRVDHVFQRCSSSRLDALRVSFPLGKESARHINKWTKLAAAQGVKELELDFHPLDFPTIAHYRVVVYDFHVQGSTSSLKYLHLKRCIFDFPPNFRGFSSLVSMTLVDIFLTEYNVQNILSSCSSLEWLSLIQCEFDEPTCLEFAGPSLLLKHLHLSYSDLSVTKIDVHDINLLSFELCGSVSTSLSIKNTPHLTRLVLGEGVQVDVLTSVPHVEILFLAGWFEEGFQILPKYDESTLPRSYMFNYLKQLVFLASMDQAELHQLVYLLEACPVLEKLELDMGISHPRDYRQIEKLTKMTKRRGTPHTNLKEIDIYGFEGFPEKIALSKYLLKKAIVLEKMKLYTATRFYQGNGKWFLDENTSEQGKKSLEEVDKLLRKEASSSTELMIVSPYKL